MKLYVKNIKGLTLPKQANENDAGYDVTATTPPSIVGTFIENPSFGKLWKRVAYIEYGTNLFVSPETEHCRHAHSFQTDLGAIANVTWKNITKEYHTYLFPRSSTSKKNLVLANSVGTIDNGYRAQILCRWKYIFQPEDLIMIPEAGGNRIYGVVNLDHLYNEGDLMIQIQACETVPIEFELVDELPKSERGEKGFGSTDDKKLKIEL